MPMRAMPGGTVGTTDAGVATRFVLGAGLAFAFFLTIGLAFSLGASFLRPAALRTGTFFVFFFALVFAFFLAAIWKSSTLKTAIVPEKDVGIDGCSGADIMFHLHTNTNSGL